MIQIVSSPRRFILPVALALLVILPICYVGSYCWWMRQTEMGRSVDEYFSRHTNPNVRTTFARFYRPARNFEKEWRYFQHRRWLPGTWLSETGNVKLQVHDDLTTEVWGLSSYKLPEGAVLGPSDATADHLFVSDPPRSFSLVLQRLPRDGAGLFVPGSRRLDPIPPMRFARITDADPKPAATKSSSP
jgi:hypothetical protein